MTSRKRNYSSTYSSGTQRRLKRRRARSASHQPRRQHLLETLESRQLLAGPQLIGIQPNDGDLIVNGTVRDTAPRVLTFRFDETQRIDATTFDGIRITRSGDDGILSTDDDVRIAPGLATLGDPNQNEVVVRFSEALPDDQYRIEVFGFDDSGLGVTGLRNQNGELFLPSEAGQCAEVVDFELRLGALVESVVPQPVIRAADGSLIQNRNEIVVYFNEDPLFVEDDASGAPTARSAENTRFYQLLFTQETVRTTDDLLFEPDEVVYDASTNTARLFFSDDINDLPGIPLGGGTFRLRVGTAVDDRVDLILPPANVPVAASAVSDFGVDGFRITFFTRAIGEGSTGQRLRFEDTGRDGLTARLDPDGTVVYDFGGEAPEVRDLRIVALGTPGVQDVIDVTWEFNGVVGQGADMLVPRNVLGAPPLVLTAVGDTLGTALDVGVFGQGDALTSLVFEESIDPQPFLIELPGGSDDPGHRELPEEAGSLFQHINDLFGADVVDGVTEIAYNFNGIFDTDDLGNSFLNQITERQKTRIREALGLWSDKIGVQFRETESEGITFALGDVGNLQPRGTIRPLSQFSLNATLRIDPTYQESALVFSNQVDFGTNYGEDFLRKATAGIGLILGLERTPDLPAQTLMTFSFGFLNGDIDRLGDLEPVFPGNFDVLHGQYVHRPDSIDVDLYRFEVNLGDEDKTGTLTAETFAERLPDSSLLDTTLTLYEQVQASVTTDFGVGSTLAVRIESFAEGRLGNNARIDFIQTDRGAGDTEIRISQSVDSTGAPLANTILIDMPRRGVNIAAVPVGDIVDAINEDPFASSIFRATQTIGTPGVDISGSGLSFSPLLLDGGGIFQLSRNDDYFSEDSRIIASLGQGTYYVGVAASGNDNYDPTIPESGFGGRTQGDYELHLKFEPQVDETDVIRDLDSDRPGVPGTRLDGDGDGVPGGVHNFWFQTRPTNRTVDFTDNGQAVNIGQEVEVIGANGVVRTFEFVPLGGAARPGNVAVGFNPGTAGFPTPAGQLAAVLQQAINGRRNETGVTASRDGTSVVLLGERSITLSDDFRGATVFGRNIFVDKIAGPQADGSLDHPFNNISNSDVPNAFDATLPGDIVRILGNGGADLDITTEADNFSYQIGISDTGGRALEDGRTMEVPQGVTTMIDAGALLKLRAARIGVGSSTLQVDRSGGALQILGTPRLVQLSARGDDVETTLLGDENADSPGYDDGSVILTSIRDRDADANAAGIAPPAAAGNWGGIIFRRDLDQSEGRRDLEDEGIFLQRVNHAEIRYGGSSNILIDSVQQLVNPVQIVNLRPTVTFNEITQSADSAISAAPDSFEETSYQAPRFQQAGEFTADYDRVGPEIHNNQLVDNSINGLFVRVATTPTEPPRSLTVAGRFDDVDVVHYVAENVIIAAKPGGSIQDGFAPSVSLVSARNLRGGGLDAGTYLYKMTFVDADGFESAPSADTFSIDVTQDESSVELTSLPQVDRGTDYVSRRLYRAVDNGAAPEFRLIAELDASAVSRIDDGTTSEGLLDLTRVGIRGRLDGSLVMDPGLVVKIQGARFELGQGTQLLAEGLGSNPVVFTSSLDDRFGGGGTFDTNNDNETANGASDPAAGDWAGIYAGPTSRVSFDNVVVAYAGGISLFEGGQTRGFNPLELQQAEGRITNSRFEFNEDGQDGAGPVGRAGRLGITPATIFVRGSQPIIVGNTFVNNRGTIIDIDSDSMGANLRIDAGRQTGDNDRLSVLDDNHGPMIRFNRYLDNQITGLEIRGGTLTTESVWDDTDIVHLLFDEITVGNFHSSGGLRLLSRVDESLVVKLTGPGTPTGFTGTGFTATGAPSDIDDRIGGSVHVIGLPGSPVVLTSFKDDTVGAGLKPDGSQFTDNNGDGIGSRPEANDWRSILLDQYSNDRNVDLISEFELSTEVAPGLNGDVENAQFLGALAAELTASDEQLRLGFEVNGYLSGPTDVDTYSFTGSPGTEIWVDIDRTSFTLDTVIELLDENGVLLARSDNSFAETSGNADVVVLDSRLTDSTTSLQAADDFYTPRGAGGLYEDFGSTNPRDAGIHFTLTGNAAQNSRSVYFFRVRSASVNPDDAAGGLTGGAYRFQVRLTEDQEFPGSVVRFADIRFGAHGIHVRGLPGSSPLLGEAQENETAISNGGFFFFGGSADNGQIDNSPANFTDDEPLGNRPQNIGNLVNNKSNVISVAGSLASTFDVDFYQMDLNYTNSPGNLLRSTVFDVDFADGFTRPNTNISVFFDPDGEFLPQLPSLVLYGADSNILDDLTSPNGENNELEKLARGSVGNGDPFIGPVSLPEGTYYIGITPDGVEPIEFTDNPLVRREPINSVERIVEDRVNFATPSTADGPRLPEFFSDDAILASGFEEQPELSPGHGKPAHFDGSSLAVTPPLTRIPEFVVAGGLTGDLPASVFNAGNLDDLDFSVADDPDIGGEFFFGVSENTSVLIPHVSIEADLQLDLADFMQFVINEDGKRVIIDVDEGYNPFQGIDDTDPDTDPFIRDPFSVDTDLVLIRQNPADPTSLQFVPGTGRITTSDPDDGRNGSLTDEFGGDSLDPFIDIVLNTGTYFVGVLRDTTNFAFNNMGGITVDGPISSDPQTYTLHVSIEDHELPPGATVDLALHFDRTTMTTTPGTLTSEPFDLTGYVAQDLPTFYYNYKYAPAIGDFATVRIFSDQDPFGATQDAAPLADDVWHQLRLPLGNFAGDTGVRVEFTYTPSGSPIGGPFSGMTEGLFIDDFVVGFAERGETVFNARGGEDRFTGFSSTDTGEYQLEMRLGTQYATPGFFGTQLDEDFDTNDRHSRTITIVAPAGDQVVDGDTFVIGDGGVNQTFEFTTTPGTVAFGNTQVIFSATDTPAQIAQAIRTAITNQTRINVEASSASGLDTQALTDGRLSLSGAARGTFLPLTSASDAPPPGFALTTGSDGNVLLPAIFHDGQGDFNYLRTQGQVIVDSNVISDVRGIGIWSEPGFRDTDPEDARQDPRFTSFFFNDPFEDDQTVTEQHPFLQLPPVGNSYPGPARHLPTLNDEVIGGLTPGIVVVNNTLDQPGYAGVKVDGETRPWMIEVPSGDGISDGLQMAIDSGGTRVVFEFEDIAGAATTASGSGTEGGDGFVDGHVPIYYRRSCACDYNGRSTEYTSIEMAVSIMQSIQGSILMTNDMAELVTATVGPSLLSDNEFENRFARDVNDYATAAVYLQGVSNIYISFRFAETPLVGDITTTLAPVGEPPQPFGRIVNNTFYGEDGRESQFAEQGDQEPSDVLLQAIDTKIGRSDRTPYVTTASIGEPTPINVGLFGESVGLQLFEDDSPSSARSLTTVGNGVEFTNIDSLPGANGANVIDADVDIADTTITVTYNETGTPTIGTNFNGYVFTGQFSRLAGVAASPTSGVTPADITFNNNEIRVNLLGVPLAGQLVLDLQFASLTSTSSDVDFYQVDLSVGDRLIVDIDTLPSGPDTIIQIFDDKGTRQTFQDAAGDTFTVGDQSTAPDYLEPTSTVETPAQDVVNTRDPFADFTALATGTFYVAVSSAGNQNFDAQGLSGRVPGESGTYQISLDSYVPQDFVISLDNDVHNDRGGSRANPLIGETFTITMIPDVDFAPADPRFDGTNQVTFEFTNAQGGRTLGNTPGSHVNVALREDNRYVVPDIMRAISDTINGFTNDPTLPNHEDENGPDGISGPIARGRAQALGGIDGDTPDIDNLSRIGGGFFTIFNEDIIFGYGHDRTSDLAPPPGSVGVAGSFTGGDGTTELYVLLENVADIEISPGAQAAGLQLDPAPGRETNNLINETGVMIAGGSSSALLNNVFINLHESAVREYTSFLGFDQSELADDHPKPMEVVVVGSVFQTDEPIETNIAANMEFLDNGGNGLTTFAGNGPSNVNGGTDDFNETIAGDEPSLQNPGGNNFLPKGTSIIVDSAVNSLVERDAFANLKQSVGIPSSNILAPIRDVNGILRADNPDFAPPSNPGETVFKDRGSNELADFVGPVAISEIPRDNDAEGLDSDQAISFINLTGGVFEEFRIQLRDNGDASDPFPGIGIDDNTVVVPVIPGLRPSGAAVTLFEDDRLLAEGIDYTFNFDETKNIITLTPLAGIWQNDRSYRIAMNNRDRSVLVAPDPSEVVDGDQLAITDSDGGTVVFEFESGFQLLLPETITLIVPEVGTNAGGLGDGDIFRIDDGDNAPIVFEFNSDTATLPGSVEVPLPAVPTPTDEGPLQDFLNSIALDIQAALQSEIDAGRLNADVRVIDNQVVLGAEPGATATTSASGLQQASRTLALIVPDAGTEAGGIFDGETFIINNGNQSITFEFDIGDGTNSPNNVVVPVPPPLTGEEVALRIRQVIAQSSLGLNPLVDGTAVYLNLPVGGTAVVPGGQLSVVGLSRTPVDGDTVIITPNDGSPEVTFEINRTDEPDPFTGMTMDDGVIDPNIPLDITRATTADEFAELMANAIRSQTIAGLDPNAVQAIDGGLLSVGGEQGLELAVTGTSLEVTGSPDVTGASTIQVFGPLLLNLPLVGGGGFLDGSVLILVDDLGNDVVFEFNLVNTLSTVPGAIQVSYNTFDLVDVVADSLVAAINGATIGITAQNVGTGRVSLGRIEADRVNTGGIPGDPLDPLDPGVPGVEAQITIRRGIVTDGEVLTLRQGATSVSFEFESVSAGGGVTAGNVPVAFQPGSTVGDVAVSLAAAINNNKGSLRLSATAELDLNGDPTGQVILDDLPGTVVDATLAPTLNIIGVPGGAIPVRISPAFTATEVKQALLVAINSVNEPGELPVTTLFAVDRGGATFFVENAQIFTGPLANYFLPAIKDTVGNALEPNRDDLTTQFTILMPTVGLDFGDAPDPVGLIRGRYPTLFDVDGARHVAGSGLMLGRLVDTDLDGIPVRTADGDDLTIAISDVGTLFETSVSDGAARIEVQADVIDALTRDGDTITIDTGVAIATLEFDIDGRFNEDNFAIQATDPTSADSIAEAIVAAIVESPLQPAETVIAGSTVLVVTDDEDGVVFGSETNPDGVLNKGVLTPVSVTVSGGGVLEAWIDFDADGDWTDPGDQIISATTPGAIFGDSGAPVTRVFNITVPVTAPDPVGALQTYARFRVSRDGNLDPTGLALSGEVEDYALLILPGTPPQISDSQANRTFTVLENPRVLQALDVDGTFTPTTTNDDGILAGVVDLEGDAIAVFADDVGERTLQTPGGTIAGLLDLSRDGTFTFEPAPDFNGVTTFSARVTDVQPLDSSTELVNSRPISVTINVIPVNDPPFATTADVEVNRTINEDITQTFSSAELIDPFYLPGPPNEATQPLIIQSAGSVRGPFLTSLGGSVSIIDNGQSIFYTPPADYNGAIPDTFTYVVADVPESGQLSEVASKPGTVSISINAVNDPPRVTNDSYATMEDEPLTIPIRDPETNSGILDNDRAGPPDEVDPPQSQTISLPSTQFPITSFRGGVVTLGNGQLTYNPPPLFSGVDQFDYTVVDSLGASASAKVSINVGGVNNAPVFIGINGNLDQDSLTFNESKVDPQQFQFDLTTWFRDPESDPMTFTASSRNESIVAARVVGDSLILDLPPFAFGDTFLTVTATDINNFGLTREIPVSVLNTPDPPRIIGTLEPLSGTEDQLVTGDLSTVFADPDGEALQYSVARIDGIVNPSASQIAGHPLLEAISFVGDEMQIRLDPDQSGSVEIEISATDGSFRVSDTFTLTVTPVEDNPVAEPDFYNVPVGSQIQILNPSSGLLRNDTDADGDTLRVDLASVSTPSRGTVSVAEDGTFTYTNIGNPEDNDGDPLTTAVGKTDSFTYRVIDSTGRPSAPVTVTLTLNQSRYQNPIADLRSDVNADSMITAIDALRIINFLSRNGNEPRIPITEIGSPPPDFLDVNGDGAVSAGDAIIVINDLARMASAAEGEMVSAVNFGTTAAFASPTNANLPVSNFEPASHSGMVSNSELVSDSELVRDLPEETIDPRDSLLAAGVVITGSASDSAVDWLTDNEAEDAAEPHSVDEALSAVLDEITLNVPLGD